MLSDVETTFMCTAALRDLLKENYVFAEESKSLPELAEFMSMPGGKHNCSKISRKRRYRTPRIVRLA